MSWGGERGDVGLEGEETRRVQGRGGRVRRALVEEGEGKLGPSMEEGERVRLDFKRRIPGPAV